MVRLRAAPEIIEDTNEVAIKIGGHELAQLPRFVLGMGNDLRFGGLPRGEECIHFSRAFQIEPEKDRGLGCRGTRGRSGDKQSAISPGDAGDAALVVPPLEGEAQRVDIVGCGLVDVGRGDFRDRKRGTSWGCGVHRSMSHALRWKFHYGTKNPCTIPDLFSHVAGKER